MDSANSTDDHNTPESRLALFFRACAREFRFLAQEHGFTYVSGIAQYRKGRRIIAPYQPGMKLPDPYEALALFEKGQTSFEISYAGDAGTLGIFVCHDRANRFTFDDILQAGKRAPRLGKALPVFAGPPTLERTLKEAAQSAWKNITLILTPNPKALKRAQLAKDKQLEQRIRAQLRREMDEATREAMRAFVKKDWRRVVELFMPYERTLSFANLKKLDIARKNLLDVR